MYPVIVAHANDHSDTGSAIQVSGGLLLVFGLGSIVGPSLAGFAMSGFSAQWLFAVTGSAHVLLVLFALLRIWMAPPVRAEDKVAFQATPLGRGSTPGTVTMAAESLEMLEQDASQT